MIFRKILYSCVIKLFYFFHFSGNFHPWWKFYASLVLTCQGPSNRISLHFDKTFSKVLQKLSFLRKTSTLSFDSWACSNKFQFFKRTLLTLLNPLVDFLLFEWIKRKKKRKKQREVKIKSKVRKSKFFYSNKQRKVKIRDTTTVFKVRKRKFFYSNKRKKKKQKKVKIRDTTTMFTVRKRKFFYSNKLNKK